MKKTYIIALSFLLILTIGIAINDYAKQYNLIVAEGSTPNPGHPIDQIDGLQSIIDDINDTISGLGVIGEGGSGDVNDDGEIDIVDSLFIASYIEGILETFTPEQKLAADYDGDGVITYYDADAIANVSAGHSKEEAIRMAYSTVGIQDKGSFYKIDHNTNIGGNLYVSGGLRVEGGSGDVNGDGLDIGDARDIAWYLNGDLEFTPEQKSAADYDGNGIITHEDAEAVAFTLVGCSKEEAIRRTQRGVFVPENNESCDNTMEGYIRYNSSAKVMQYCNGSTWTNL